MAERANSKLVFIMIILTIIFFITTVISYYNLYRQRTDRDREIALRMDLEEKMSKITAEFNKVRDQLEQELKAHQATRQMLSQPKAANENLNTEAEKTQKLKETSEEDLKDVLVTPSQKTR